MERILRNVLEASATTFCAASSQLFGDSESISITFTIFAMSLISVLLDFARRHEYGRKVRAGLTRLLDPPILIQSRSAPRWIDRSAGDAEKSMRLCRHHYAAAVTCWMVSCSFCTSIGLVRCAEKPARLLRSRSSSM